MQQNDNKNLATVSQNPSSMNSNAAEGPQTANTKLKKAVAKI